MSQNYVLAVLAVCFSAFVGYGLLAVIIRGPFRHFSRYEVLGYSFALGQGVLAGAMLTLSAVGLDLSVLPILSLLLLPVVSILLFRARSSCVDRHPPLWSLGLFCRAMEPIPRWLSLSLLLGVIGVAFVGCLAEPIAEIDATAAWAFHAKVFFTERTALPTFLTEGGCGHEISHWPPLFPLAQTWVHLAMGTYDDLAVKITFPFYYLALLGILYGALRRYLPGPYSLALTLVFATVPALVVPFPAGSVASGYADFPLALFTGAAACVLILWVGARDARILLLAAVFAGLAMWTKREGIAFALICAVSVWIMFLLLRRRHRMIGLGSPVLFTLVCAGFLSMQVLYCAQFVGPFFCEPAVRGATVSVDVLAKLTVLSKFMLLEMFNPSRWGFLWILAAVLTIVRFRVLKNMALALLLFLILGHLAAVLVVMAVDAWSAEVHAALGMRRILIPLAPLATMVVAMLGAVSTDRETLRASGH